MFYFLKSLYLLQKPFVGMYTKLLDGMDIPVTPEITKLQNDISIEYCILFDTASLFT